MSRIDIDSVPPVFRGRFVLLALALVFLQGCGGGPPDRPVPDGPNVILISIDSLRSDHLGSSGYSVPTCPNLDRLAREGAAFPQTVSTTSWTLPAHVSMLTSLNSAVHGVRYGRALDPARSTLAERLDDAGYRTAGFATGPWMTSAFGMDQGFRDFVNTSELGSAAFRDGDGTRPNEGAHAASHGEVTGPQVSDLAIDWLGKHGDEPFFLFLHYWDVHYDYVPPEPYPEMFDPGYAGQIDGRGFAQNPAVNPRMAPRDLQHIVALYDGEIRSTDFHVGRVLSALEQRGILDDTLVVVTADHGDEFFEHGEKGHNKSLYDEVVVVPLLVRWPERVPAGLVYEGQTRLIDVFPTILDLVRVAPGDEAMGRSLTPLIDGRELPELAAFCDLFLLQDYRFHALRRGSVKAVVRYVDDQARGAVFDLARDPGERRPQAPQGPRYEPAFRELEATRDLFTEMATALPGSGSEVEISPEMEERLRRLGYIE